jgi:CBS domain containing-hemolysin-like protein
MRIGELIIEELGRIPSQGEIFNLYDAEFTVVDGTPRVINSVQIRRLEPKEFPEDGDTSSYVTIDLANPSK